MAEHLENFDVDVIELFDDDGESAKFQLLDTIKMDGKTYIVLTDTNDAQYDDDDDDDGNVYIMSVVKNGDEDVLEMVSDEDEIQKVFDEFKDYLQSDFEFLDDDED